MEQARIAKMEQERNDIIEQARKDALANHAKFKEELGKINILKQGEDFHPEVKKELDEFEKNIKDINSDVFKEAKTLDELKTEVRSIFGSTGKNVLEQWITENVPKIAKASTDEFTKKTIEDNNPKFGEIFLKYKEVLSAQPKLVGAFNAASKEVDNRTKKNFGAVIDKFKNDEKKDLLSSLKALDTSVTESKGFAEKTLNRLRTEVEDKAKNILAKSPKKAA